MDKEMAHRIWKYDIPLTDEFSLPLPEGAQFLAVQIQHGSPRAWFKVDPEQAPVPRHFRLVGTGNPCEQEGLIYQGTFQLGGGAAVFHLFEKEV